jgi:hypothetical protein
MIGHRIALVGDDVTPVACPVPAVRGLIAPAGGVITLVGGQVAAVGLEIPCLCRRRLAR